jgi:hypothetical protein
MNHRTRREYLTSGSSGSQSRWKFFFGIWCVATISALLLAGCADLENKSTFPPVWRSVTLGMQRAQVCALLGNPTQAGDAEEVYSQTIQKTHWELHIQYNGGGTVAAKRYYYFK